MPKSSSYPGIETDYPVLTNIPADAEMHIVADGQDYNITLTQIIEANGVDPDGSMTGAEIATSLDTYLGSTDWRAGATGGDILLLDEDNFASNSDTAAPSQQSTKVYVDTAVAAATVIATEITDSTAAGRSMLTAADAAAQRTLLNVEDGATGDQTGAEIVTLLEALTTTDRLSYTGVDGLDGAGAGALYEAALIASVPLTASQVVQANSGATALQGLDVEPASPAPGTASSSSGAITLDFDSADIITTTLTENITAITISNLDLYEFGAWRVTQGATGYDIDFTVTNHSIPGGASSNTLGANNNTVIWITFYRSGASTYDVFWSDHLEVAV